MNAAKDFVSIYTLNIYAESRTRKKNLILRTTKMMKTSHMPVKTAQMSAHCSIEHSHIAKWITIEML